MIDGGAEAHICGAVRAAILERKLAPGTRLPEAELGRHFGVSRTIVRQALRTLAHEGIVAGSRNANGGIGRRDSRWCNGHGLSCVDPIRRGANVWIQSAIVVGRTWIDIPINGRGAKRRGEEQGGARQGDRQRRQARAISRG